MKITTPKQAEDIIGTIWRRELLEREVVKVERTTPSGSFQESADVTWCRPGSSANVCCTLKTFNRWLEHAELVFGHVSPGAAAELDPNVTWVKMAPADPELCVAEEFRLRPKVQVKVNSPCPGILLGNLIDVIDEGCRGGEISVDCHSSDSWITITKYLES